MDREHKFAQLNSDVDENIKLPDRGNKKRRWLLAILIVSNIIAIAIPLIMELTGGSVADDITKVRLQMSYILLAFGCFIVAILADWIRYMIITKTISKKAYPKISLQIGIIGRYYDNITPSGVGGQPFQIYYLNKDGIPKGDSATIPITAFSLNQFAFVVIALVVIAFGYSLDGVWLMTAVFLGIVLYFAIPFAIILFSLMPGKLDGLVCGICRFLHKLHIIKAPDEKSVAWLATVKKYQSALTQMWQHKLSLFVAFIFSLVYFAAILVLPYFVLKAFNADIGLIEVFATNTLIYCAVSIVPTPGNAGAAEGLFYQLFKVVSPGYVFWAVLIWRFFCYYGFIIAGIIVFVLRMFKNKQKHLTVIPTDEDEIV